MEVSPLDQVIPSWDAPTLQGFDPNIVPGERSRGASRQYVRFYKKTFIEVYAKKVKINEKTGTTQVLQTGSRPVEKEMVHIVTPGDKNEIDDVATTFHKRNFWQQYKAFRDGRTAPIGLNLDECNFISPGVVTELKYLGCHTAEQLADSSDDLCNQVPDGWMLREFAKQYCKTQTDNKQSEQVNLLRVELEKSREVITQMRQEMNEMKGLVLDSKGQIAEIPKTKETKIKPGELE